MRYFIILFIAVTRLSCNFQNESNMNEIVLKQATIVVVDGVKVGCMTVCRDEYVLPDGSKRRGVVATLYIDDKDTQVVVGSDAQFKIETKIYVVDKVLKRNLFRRRGVIYFHKL